MTGIMASEKGQMSFDMAFAVVLILLIFAMLAGYFQTSSSAASETSKLMALSVIADYTVGNLQALYNSLQGSEQSANATYILDMRGDTMYGDLDKPYVVDYKATRRPGNTLRFALADDTNTFIDRELGFSLTNCDLNSLDISPGDKIKMTGCHAQSGGSLSCACSKST